MTLNVRVVVGAVLLALSAATVAGEIIDRVLAVVGGRIITLSDVRGAVRLGLVPLQEEGDPLASALQRLVDRRLVLVEIERYAPPEPPPAAIDAAVATVRERFATEATFDDALAHAGLTREDLRRFLRDTLRIEAYQQQRFASMLQPSDDELLDHYRDHADAFTVEGVRRPFDAVREQVLARVIAARRDALVAEWLEGLRRRGDVVVLYLPAG